MSNFLPRLVLPLAVCAALAACSDEPEPTAAETPTAAAEAPQKVPPALQQPEPRTPFERAVRTLGNGGSFSFESEITLPGGDSEYATGVSDNRNYSATVRTLPKPSAEFDGNWVFQGGRWFRQSPTGYESIPVTPRSAALLAEALSLLPQTEDDLTAEKPGKKMLADGECQPRAVNLPQRLDLLAKYSQIDVCIDEESARLVELEAKLQSGEQLRAELARHGESVAVQKVDVPDWSQEFPRR